MTQHAAPVVAARAALPRSAAVYGALALAVATQMWLAWTYGALPATQRAAWPVAITLTGLLAVPTACVLWSVWSMRATAPSRAMLLAAAAAGLLMRLPYLAAGPALEDDFYRYMLDGAMLAHGVSPYMHAPESVLRDASIAPFAATAAAREAIGAINFPDLRSIYPGTAQLLFAAAHGIDPWGIWGIRVIVLVCEMATAGLLWLLVTRLGRPPWLVALVWCNPALAFLLTGQGHIDAALAPLVIAALLAAVAGRGLAAGVCLGLATGVKLWPVLLAPLLARRLARERRQAVAFLAAGAVLTLLLCAPLLLASLSARSGLVAYAAGWTVNNAPYAWLSHAAYLVAGDARGEMVLRMAVGALAAAVSLAVAWRPVLGPADLAARSALAAAAVFYLTPAQFPWYAIWFLPLAAASASPALVAASATLPVYFLFFPLAEMGMRDVHGYALAALHLLPVLAVALLAPVQRAEQDA